MTSKSTKILIFFSCIIVYFLILERVSHLPNNVVFKMYFQSEVKARRVTNKEMFAEYLRKFNKSYGVNESIKRFRHFKKNLKEIDRLNAKTKTATYGVTKFSDLSKRELSRMFPSLGDCEPRSEICTHGKFGRPARAGPRVTPYEKPPPRKDWREEHVVGDILDQHVCPICWAFSIAGVMESMSVIQHPTRKFSRLSIQEVMDCTFYDGENKTGCREGRPLVNVLDFLCNTVIGVTTEEEYPLTFAEENCRSKFGERTLERFENKCNLYKDEEKLVELLAQGPVTATVDAYFLFNYIDGIISEHCEVRDPAKLNHALQIVGYDRKGPIPYYIVRNSWGTDWGEKGYARIAIGGNHCGIAMSVGHLEVN